MNMIRTSAQSIPAANRFFSKWQSLTPYIFISPFYILFAIFFLRPSLYAIYLSFHRWSLVHDPTYVEFKNFERLLEDSVFEKAVYNTLVYASASLFIVVPLALLLAVALNSKLLWLKPFWRVIYFAPIVTSTVAVSMTFLTLFNRDYGLLNSFLREIGLQPIDWLGNREVVKNSIIIVIIWRWTGLTSVYFLAGLQSIPEDLYEAAKIDGANTVRLFRHITLPQLRPVIIFVSIFVTIGSLQIFDEPQVLTGGGPANSSLSVTQYLISRGINNQRYGYAASIGLVMWIAIFTLSMIQLGLFRVFGKQED